MTLTKNADGTLAVNLTVRQFQVLVGTLGVVDHSQYETEAANEEGYAIFDEITDLAKNNGIEVDPFKNGITTTELHPELYSLTQFMNAGGILAVLEQQPTGQAEGAAQGELVERRYAQG